MTHKSFTCVKEAKIFSFVLVSQVGDNLLRAEQILSELLNEGWNIAAAGGVSGDPGEPLYPWGNGFLILVRERRIPADDFYEPKMIDDEIWEASDGPDDWTDETRPSIAPSIKLT